MLKVNTDRLEETSGVLTAMNSEMFRIEESLSEIRYEFSRQPICGTEENAARCSELIYGQERELSRLAEVLHDLAAVVDTAKDEYAGCENSLEENSAVMRVNMQSLQMLTGITRQNHYYSTQAVSSVLEDLIRELPIQTDYKL
ncbi:MAG: hypothetical protein LUC98_01405 [Lachnospiraceae bacterium]|nr:hypothetical protein [Lachnospiraceae bacterium]